MIKSMTGFGKGEFTDGKRNVICEIRSVNHRYSDIFIKMPRRYSFAEEKIKSIIKETVKRGKVEVSVVVESITEEDITIKLNPLVARQYIDNLRMLKDEFGLEGEISLETIANLPDVMKNAPDIDDEEEVTSSIEEAVRTAVANLDQMRVTEGQKLAEDLTMRGELIRKYVSEIEERAPEIVKEYKQKLYERISELVEGM
ncbi:MAG: YicC/YloC family endoribonuclease, partial [Anaerovoracaceae bacterium]|nr:YicC/YloC family endoribonuclease [Anaerovoracaceae bacterium]